MVPGIEGRETAVSLRGNGESLEVSYVGGLVSSCRARVYGLAGPVTTGGEGPREHLLRHFGEAECLALGSVIHSHIVR